MTVITRRASIHRPAGANGGTRVAANGSRALKLAPISSATSPRRHTDTCSAELIAAAHAGSFSLALAQELGRAAFSVGDIFTSAAVSLERLAAGWSIVKIHLNVVARLPKVTQGRFIEATVRAKTNCLVSRALRATISMNAKLEK